MLRWWKSAVNLSFFLSLAILRMCSSACDTLTRLCVRHVLCWLAFPLVPALGSTGSAADCSALFAGFAATVTESDFSWPRIIGYGSSPSRCGPPHPAPTRWFSSTQAFRTPPRGRRPALQRFVDGGSRSAYPFPGFRRCASVASPYLPSSLAGEALSPPSDIGPGPRAERDLNLT